MFVIETNILFVFEMGWILGLKFNYSLCYCPFHAVRSRGNPWVTEGPPFQSQQGKASWIQKKEEAESTHGGSRGTRAEAIMDESPVGNVTSPSLPRQTLENSCSTHWQSSSTSTRPQSAVPAVVSSIRFDAAALRTLVHHLSRLELEAFNEFFGRVPFGHSSLVEEGCIGKALKRCLSTRITLLWLNHVIKVSNSSNLKIGHCWLEMCNTGTLCYKCNNHTQTYIKHQHD